MASWAKIASASADKPLTKSVAARRPKEESDKGGVCTCMDKSVNEKTGTLFRVSTSTGYWACTDPRCVEAAKLACKNDQKTILFEEAKSLFGLEFFVREDDWDYTYGQIYVVEPQAYFEIINDKPCLRTKSKSGSYDLVGGYDFIKKKT